MKFKHANIMMLTVLMSFLAFQIIGCSTESGGGAATGIKLSATDHKIPVGGRSTTIAATVTDSKGEAVPLGTGVTFETTNGSFSNGKSRYEASTVDESGSVRVALMSGTVPGVAEITCTVGSVTQKGVITFTSLDSDNVTVLPATIAMTVADASVTLGTSTSITAN
ncbi:MAG: hypothetical protein L7F78_07140, partial [Syntrophales bacterium LBB04]|nr:hypothetical protein [Syntrophales bacterium LBB04]